jgi:hypothetical protein
MDENGWSGADFHERALGPLRLQKSKSQSQTQIKKSKKNPLK